MHACIYIFVLFFKLSWLSMKLDIDKRHSSFKWLQVNGMTPLWLSILWKRFFPFFLFFFGKNHQSPTRKASILFGIKKFVQQPLHYSPILQVNGYINWIYTLSQRHLDHFALQIAISVKLEIGSLHDEGKLELTSNQ